MGVLQYHIWPYGTTYDMGVPYGYGTYGTPYHETCHIPRLSSRCRCRSNMYQCTAVHCSGRDSIPNGVDMVSYHVVCQLP